MGLDIGVVEYRDGRWIQDRGPDAYRWGGRLVGENAFARAEFPHVYRDGQAADEYPWRPSDFAFARKWVRDSDEIPDGNKALFYELLAALESNPNLWVYVSV